MVSQDENVVETKGLNHWFGTGEAQKQALFDIDLSIRRGSLTVLMGPSGSGKTTFLTLIGCLRDVMGGSVRVLGQELNRATRATNEMLRKKSGFIFQAHNLHESLSALQNVMMGLQVHGRATNEQNYHDAAVHMLGLVGLADRVHYLPGNLSGGQKQRVAVARALVANPEVVFADEPTAALDRESGMNVVHLLKRLGDERGTTTIMVTHDGRILDQANRIITLEDGRVVHQSDEKP